MSSLPRRRRPSGDSPPNAGNSVDPAKAAAIIEKAYGRCDVLVNSAGFTRMIPHHDLEALTDDLIDAILRSKCARSVRDHPSVCAVDETVGRCGDREHLVGRRDRRDRQQHRLRRVEGRAGHHGAVAGAHPGAGDPRAYRSPPPAAWTPRSSPGRTTAMVEKVAATTPLKRVVQADEVAQAVMAAVVNLTLDHGVDYPGGWRQAGRVAWPPAWRRRTTNGDCNE